MPKPAKALQFQSDKLVQPVVDIAVARHAAPSAQPAATPAIDLSDKPALILLIGRGSTGKTTLARYLIEHATGPILTAALDPVNRTLANYVGNVSQPETADPAASARWLRDFLDYALSGKFPAVIDFGGGDTTLGKLLDEIPDLESMVEDAGMSLVALYTMAPRVDDLAPLVSLGFQPRATALVLNDLGDPSLPATEAFAPLIAQPVVQTAVERGAQLVWMPRLDAATVSRIETRRLSFRAAGAVEGGLGPFASAQVRAWLRRMETSFAGVKSWLV